MKRDNMQEKDLLSAPLPHRERQEVGILLIFFNRPDHFGEVFEEVRKARPERLFLYQDGPRNDRDLPGIEACRRIAENIDWPCRVERLYQERNYGCDPSEFIAQKWAFSFVDRCIVLEDDDVPSQSFFPFCEELLERYADDPRVTMIAGFNSDEVTPDVAADYFFTTVFSIWGWASWRRVVDQWDEHYTWLDNPDIVGRMQQLIDERKLRSDFLQMCRDHRASGKAYYETIFWSHMLISGGMAIMPTRNQINNRGLTADSTHFSGSLATTPRRLRRQFTMRRFELDFPLRHPAEMVENTAFKERVYRRNAWDHPWIKIQYSLEELWLNLRHGNFGIIAKAIRKRIGKWAGKAKHQ